MLYSMAGHELGGTSHLSVFIFLFFLGRLNLCWRLASLFSLMLYIYQFNMFFCFMYYVILYGRHELGGRSDFRGRQRE